jgi:hypothetical protein
MSPARSRAIANESTFLASHETTIETSYVDTATA